MFSNCCCNSDNSKNKKVGDKVFLTEDLKCNPSWCAKIWFDTTFTEKIKCRIGSFCKYKVSYIDTIELEGDTLLIRKHHDLEFHVLFTPNWSAQVIDKSNYFDFLAEDLKSNGFLTPPYDLIFHPEDTSITFKTFIGHANSDVGDIYILRLDKTSKTKVIAVEASDMDDQE
jgi:hypothetical protein